MESHTIRQTKPELGFIADNKMAIVHNCNRTMAFHFNKGPKKVEEYPSFLIRDSGKYWVEYYNTKDIICNEHIYIQIAISKEHGAFMRGFISNFLESDLENIEFSATFPDLIRVVSDTVFLFMDKIDSTENTKEYLKSIFGKNYSEMFPYEIQDCYGIRLFQRKIHLNLFDKTFGVDLSNITLKDEFNELIKANVDRIKNMLFQTNIPGDGNYLTF